MYTYTIQFALITLLITSLLATLTTTVFAQDAENARQPEPQDSTEQELSCDASVNKTFEMTIDAFLEPLKIKNERKSYLLTAPEFRKAVTSKEFSELVEGSGLAKSLSHEWIIFEQPNNKEAQIGGIFDMPNGEKYMIRFNLEKIKNEWKIKGIFQSQLSLFLRDTFPKSDDLDRFVRAEIERFEKALHSKKFSLYYNAMSKSARTSTKKVDIVTAMKTFAEKNVDIHIPDGARITYSPCFPAPNANGIMILKASYENENFKIAMNFQYINEWVWKLYSFNMSADPVK